MYDPKNEPHEFVADGREEALAKASRYFGVEIEALAVHELSIDEAYGLGGRTVVVAVPRERKARPRSANREDRDRGRPPRTEERRERGGRRDGGGRRERDARRKPAPPTEPSVGTVRGGPLGPMGEFVLGVVERLDLGPFEISESGDGEVVVYEVRGSAATALSMAEARAVDALQLLVNQAAVRHEPDAPRVVLDFEGNAESRERYLTRLADRVMRRAREGGRAVALDPMNPRDRRVIHLAARDAEGIASMSIGEGRYRQVVVVPEGAPEYEEAVKQSEAASHRE